MTTMRVNWTVNNLETVMASYDVQKVWRSPTLSPPSWTEITTAATRVTLVENQLDYLFYDTGGSETDYYAVTYFNTTTLAESAVGTPFQGIVAGYITLGDVRNEGFTVTMVSDAQVLRGIQKATAVIDAVTRQWFEPRQRAFRLDGRRGQDLLLEVPIIAITSMGLVDYRGEIDDIDLDDVWVYNRHLTQGLRNPDDRHDPRITWRDLLPAQIRSERRNERLFVHGRGNVYISGLFGYTDLGPYEIPGETADGSQIPTSYGQTPELIKTATMLLTIRNMYPLATGDGDAFAIRNRILSETTRDQSYTLADMSDEDSSYGMTGDIEVDKILAGFIAPMATGVV